MTISLPLLLEVGLHLYLSNAENSFSQAQNQHQQQIYHLKDPVVSTVNKNKICLFHRIVIIHFPNSDIRRMLLT